MMFKILDEKEIKDFEKIKSEYKEYISLVFPEGEEEKGRVYAIANFEDLEKLSDFQFEFYEKGITTIKLRDFSNSKSICVKEKWLN